MGILYELQNRNRGFQLAKTENTMLRYYTGKSPDLVRWQAYRIKVLSECVLVFSPNTDKFYGKFPLCAEDWF